jgi:hypothetical protein
LYADGLVYFSSAMALACLYNSGLSTIGILTIHTDITTLL